MKDKNGKSNRFRFVAAVCFWIGLWWVGSEVAGSSFLLPGPAATLRALHVLVGQVGFYQDVAATLSRCAAGMLLSLIIGLLTAALAYKHTLIRTLLAPPVSFLKAVPVMAIIIYGLLLLTAGNVPVMACFLMCYPVVYSNILSGLDYTDKQLLEMSKVYNLGIKTRIQHVYLPTLLSALKSALSLIAGLSWKSVIAAEVLSIPAYSMGYELQQAKIYFDTDYLFAWIAAIVCLSLIFEKLIKALVSRLDIREYQGSHIIKTAGPLDAAGFDSIDLPYAPLYTNSRNVNDIIAVQLCKSYGNLDVLTNYDMVLPFGTLSALSAPSGSGKTTLLRMLSGLEKPDSGTVSITKVSYMFQENRLLPWLNVYDNIAVVLKSHDSKAGSALGSDEVQLDYAIKTILKGFQLEDSIYKLPSQLSGGMQRRVALARALLYPADLLLLDEPFTGLDEVTKQHIIGRLPNYTKNKTTLLVSHNQEDCLLASEIFTI